MIPCGGTPLSCVSCRVSSPSQGVAFFKMSKNIYRQKRKSNYTIVPNEMLNDKRLSWKAKGMLAYLLSLPDTWEVYVAHIRTISTDGNDSTSSGLNELIEFKYVWRKPRSGNEPGGWEYYVYDEPHLENPFRQGDFPKRDFPESGKPATSKEIEEEVITKKERKQKPVDSTFLTELQKLNPEKDVEREAQNAQSWLLAHPDRKYTRAFLTAWVIRSTNTIKPERFANF